MRTEQGLQQLLLEKGMGCIAYSPLAQMALAWVLRGSVVTSALIGASSTSQLRENAGALEGMDFTAEELARIDRILREEPGTMPT